MDAKSKRAAKRRAPDWPNELLKYMIRSCWTFQNLIQLLGKNIHKYICIYIYMRYRRFQTNVNIYTVCPYIHACMHTYITLPYTTLHYVTCFTCITRITCITYIPTYRHTDRQNRTEHYYVVITLIKPKIHTHLLYITLHCITLHYISIIRNNTRNTYKTYIHTYIHTYKHTYTNRRAHTHTNTIHYIAVHYKTKQYHTYNT